MEICTLRTRKQKMQEEITKAIESFQEETGVAVSAIDVSLARTQIGAHLPDVTIRTLLDL